MWVQEITNSKGIRYKYYKRFINPKTKKYVCLSVVLNSNNHHAIKKANDLLKIKFDEKLEKEKTQEERRNEKIKQLTFYMVADEWREYVKPMVKIETDINHLNAIRRIKEAINPTLYFFDFTPTVAKKIAYDMYYTEKLSFAYSNSILTTIKSIMKYAHEAGYIESITSFTDLRLKKRPSTPKELERSSNKFLDKEELKSCLNQLYEKNQRISLAMEFMALTGLRCGELLALRVQDYDKKNHRIDINGTIVKSVTNGDNIQRGTPKNIYSYRKIDLNERAVQIIERLILENKKSALWNKKQYKDKGYIFTTNTGNPYNIQYINSKLRTVDVAGKKISTHVFRHTHISMLAELGIPLKAIMQRVGHNDPNTTLSIYTHVTTAMQKELKNKIKSLSI